MESKLLLGLLREKEKFDTPIDDVAPLFGFVRSRPVIKAAVIMNPIVVLDFLLDVSSVEWRL